MLKIVTQSPSVRRSFIALIVGTAFLGFGQLPGWGQTVINVGTIWSETHSGTLGARRFAELAAEKTNNAVEVRVLPNSQLGNEREIFEGIRLGTIEMGYIAGNIIQNLEPTAALPSLPYLFANYEQAFAVEDGPIGDEISQRILEASGTRTLGFFTTGFRHVAAKKPLRSLEDFRGLNIRVPESPLFVATFRLLGANPTPIPFGELYTALQTNMIEAAESPPAVLDSAKVFEVADYLVATSHIYSSGHILISEQLWQGLSPEIQAALQEAASEAEEYQRTLVRESEEATLQALEASGVTIVQIDTAPLQAAVASYYDEFANQIGGDDLIEQARAMR